MKALLICPDERNGVAGLAKSAPLSNIPILGKSLIEYWLEHLANLGAKEILVLATDRPDSVRALIGDGARWGLRVTVESKDRELSPDEAHAKYQDDDDAAWMLPPNDIILADYLPGLPHLPLSASYSDWFAAVQALMPQALTSDRIGVHELKPGVWVGSHTHIAPDAKLIAPCWIGEYSRIEAGAVIGPTAVLEREVVIARGAEVSQSVIGPETFVGQFTEIRNSLAWGSTLINWKRDSCLKVPDGYLLCSLEPHRAPPVPAKTPVRVESPLSALLRFREYMGELVESVLAEIGPPR